MKTRSLNQKLILGLTAGLLCGQTFLRIGDFTLGKVVPPIVLIIFALIIIITSTVYTGIWIWRNRKSISNNSRTEIFWINAIRYGVALDLAMFGFQKIFHLQAFTPLGMLDEPFSSISDKWLMWSFFGRSYAYLVTIGLSQIAGSLLLVFNRTRLLGVIVLLPIILNIVLLDYFYGLEMGVLIHALTVMAGLLCLLALDYKRLVDFFVKHRIDSSFQTNNRVMKYIGRLSIVFIPLLVIAAKPSPDKHPEVTGKYRVTEMNINGKTGLATSPCDSLLTVVYFDIANDCVFEFNGVNRRMYGSYALDAEGRMQTQWHYPPAAKDKIFSGRLKKLANDEIELIGHVQQDSLRVKLTKQR